MVRPSLRRVRQEELPRPQDVQGLRRIRYRRRVGYHRQGGCRTTGAGPLVLISAAVSAAAAKGAAAPAAAERDAARRTSDPEDEHQVRGCDPGPGSSTASGFPGVAVLAGVERSRREKAGGQPPHVDRVAPY